MLFLHCRKIVHGDLKPVNQFFPSRASVLIHCQGNVLIDEAGCARLTDFGLSKVKSIMTTRTTANIQQAQAIISGTRAFMSPERLRGGRLDFPVDVYAFAMSMYQVCNAHFSGRCSITITVSMIDHHRRGTFPKYSRRRYSANRCRVQRST